MTIIELGAILSLSFANSPYGIHNQMPPTTAFDYMSLEQSHRIGCYYKLIAGARMAPTQWNRLNPITGNWTVEVGWHLEPFQVFVGHKSEHDIGNSGFEKLTESLDFVGVKYRIEFK
jgi:hypothetical protein